MNFWNWIGLPSAVDIRELKEASLKQAEALSALCALNKNVIQLLEDTRNISEKSDKLSEAAWTYYENVSQMILKQSEALSASFEPLKTFLQDFRRMDKDAQNKLKQILTECGNQNELLRLLIANSLINDVSQILDEDKYISANHH